MPNEIFYVEIETHFDLQPTRYVTTTSRYRQLQNKIKRTSAVIYFFIYTSAANTRELPLEVTLLLVEV